MGEGSGAHEGPPQGAEKHGDVAARGDQRRQVPPGALQIGRQVFGGPGGPGHRYPGRQRVRGARAFRGGRRCPLPQNGNHVTQLCRQYRAFGCARQGLSVSVFIVRKRGIFKKRFSLRCLAKQSASGAEHKAC